MAMKKEFTLENFFKAMGIGKNFELAYIFKEIYNIIYRSIEEHKDFASFEEGMYYYSEKKGELVKELFAKGWKVHTGYFGNHGDESTVENFLALTDLFVHNSIIFFDAQDCSY
jgi:hypothetical protein